MAPSNGDAATAAAATSRQQEDDDDLSDLILAHRHRLSLVTAPRQSSFRVVALVFYELETDDDGDDDGAGRVSDGGGPSAPPPPTPMPMPMFTTTAGVTGQRRRYYALGTNDEPCHISGSICAERAALVQLRFLPNISRISKVVIVTDARGAISPGMLCREFMASHPRMGWDVPIVLGGGICRRCGLDVSGGLSGESGMAKAAASDELTAELISACNAAATTVEGASSSSSSSSSSSLHDFGDVRTTLRHLYPHPSPYVHLTAEESVQLGEAYAVRRSSEMLNGEEGEDSSTEGSTLTADEAVRLLEARSAAEVRRLLTTQRTNQSEAIPMNGGGEGGDDDRPPSDDASEDQVTTANAHLNDNEVLLHIEGTQYKVLTRRNAALHLRNLAVVASKLDSKSDLHPIRYGAAVLFSDGTFAASCQKKALEYGCTLDAVGQLAHVIEGKRLASSVSQRQQLRRQGDPDASLSSLSSSAPPLPSSVRPVLLVQSDQYGVLHAPFAPARAYLSEHGYGDCDVAVHNGNIDMSEEGEVRKDRDGDGIVLVKVDALAPSAPNIWGEQQSHAS